MAQVSIFILEYLKTKSKFDSEKEIEFSLLKYIK